MAALVCGALAVPALAGPGEEALSLAQRLNRDVLGVYTGALLDDIEASILENFTEDEPDGLPGACRRDAEAALAPIAAEYIAPLRPAMQEGGHQAQVEQVVASAFSLDQLRTLNGRIGHVPPLELGAAMLDNPALSDAIDGRIELLQARREEDADYVAGFDRQLAAIRAERARCAGR
ncbi:hypothetical protein ACLB90_13330 [Stenotrophomonas sp. LGBM10]|uniref:hypothetical protein n=1 Tax=Stenotrophomonas sp. LGBM10 TaxID=3390038 RepID=UPI00398AA099